MATYYTLLFTRLGRLFSHGSNVRTYQSTLDTQYADTVGEFSGADIEFVERLSRSLDMRKAEVTSTLTDIQHVARKTMIETTDGNFTLREKNERGALVELVKQMIADSKTVDGNTGSIGATSAGASNTGNGTMVASILAPIVDRYGHRPGNLFLQNFFSETIRSRCIADSTQNIIDQGVERFTVEGQRSVGKFHQDWPSGSGLRTDLNAVTPKTDGGRTVSKNICTNSDFENFTSNAPNNWTIETGTAGTHIFAAGSGYSGSNALKFVGDGSTTPRIYQRLRVTSETLGQMNPDKPYTIAFAAKYATAAPTVSIRVSIENGSGTRLFDGDVSREMSLTKTSAQLTTSYQLFTTSCFSPTEIPKGSRIVIEFTGNIANTSEVFIDHLTVAQMTRSGAGLPAFQMIAGSTDFRYGDEFSIAVTNNNEGGFQQEFHRFFDMNNFGLALPANTAGGENIADSLIS